MEHATRTTGCTVWRSKGPIATEEGRLEVTRDGRLRFSVDDAVAWEVDVGTATWKSPWYSFGAALRVKAPAEAAGLYMGYPPKNRGTVGNAIDAKTARERLRPLRERLTRITRESAPSG